LTDFQIYGIIYVSGEGNNPDSQGGCRKSTETIRMDYGNIWPPANKMCEKVCETP